MNAYAHKSLIGILLLLCFPTLVQLALAQDSASAPERRASAPASIQVCGPRSSDYPPESIKANEQGTSRVRFVVSADGQLKSASLVKSSGFSRLDEAALKFLSACKFRPGRDNDGKWTEAAFVVDYVWKLPD